nr:zinc finger, CCHC-type [Tanacetum cinerariifolium]
MVEHNNSSRYNDNKGKRKRHDTKADPNKKPKVTCWKCGKPGHLKKDCKPGNIGNKSNRSGTKGSVDGSFNSLKGQNMFNKSLQVYYVTYVSEAYFVQDDVVAWWVDLGATVHVCKDRCWSLTNTPIALMLDDPKTFDEAMKFQDVAFWKEIINDAMDSIMGNKTWMLDDLPPGCKPLGYKWIFKRKLKVNGTIKKFKTVFLNGDFEEEVYMNQPHDFIMPGNENKVDLTKEFLSSNFSMKNIGEADVILCIRIKHGSNGIAISHSYYIEKVLKKFNYFDCTPVSTSMDTSEKLMPNNSQAVSQLKYSRVIGCLMYAMTCTRLDIAFAVGKLSRYTSNPSTQHWQAIQRVLKYLKKTIDYRLTYTGYPLVLEGYTNASWISNIKDNSPASGWVFLLGGGAISWASKKKTCIIGSIIESKFMALTAAGKEAKWLKNLLLKIPLWSKPIAPISIRCDSAATLAKAYSQMYNRKSRHLGVKHIMIHELIMN